MSLVWTITLEGKLPIKADDIEFLFKDISRLNQRVLRPGFFQDLFNRIEEYDHYIDAENVKNVINNEGESLPYQLCSVLFSTEKETQQKRGVIFLRLDDGNFLPVGIWPTEFAEPVMGDLNILSEYIKEIIQQPEKYNDVRFFIPIKLGEEPEEVPKQVLWSVVLEGQTPDSEDDWAIEFADLKQYKKEPKTLVNRYFQELINILDSNPHYHVLRQIKQVKSNMNETLPIDTCIVINTIAKTEELYLNFLLHSTTYGDHEIIGIWPPMAAETFMKNEDLFNRLILQLVQNPEFFKEVYIFIPIELEEQLARKEPENVWSPVYKAGLEIKPKDQIQFVDCIEEMGHIAPLNSFFTQLKANVTDQSHYQIYNDILEFRLQSNEVLKAKQFAFVFGTTKEDSTQGLLFKKGNGRYVLQGIWPERLLTAYTVDDKILFEFIDAVVQTPEAFKEIKLFIPS